jgi:ethanolamine utilization protein EutA
MLPASPSIDSLDLREFDFIEVGKILDQSGAVVVVIKSLVFPSDTIAAS